MLRPLLALMLLVGPATPLLALDTIFVAPGGNDALDGRTRARAVLTLERARDLLRARRASGGISRGAVVFLLSGEHRRVSAFVLGPLDGGTPREPVVYAGPSDGSARITGARWVVATRVSDPAILARVPVPARSALRMFTLEGPLSRLPGRGDGSRPMIPEVFDPTGPLSLARWPDSGWRTVRDVSTSPLGDTLELDVPPPRVDGTAFLEGYPFWDWAWGFAPIRGVSAGGRLSVGRESAGYGWREDQRVAITNLLAGIDRPGRYAVDAESQAIYAWPRAGDSLQVGVLDAPLVVVDSLAYVRFVSLTFGPTGGVAVSGRGSRGVTLRGVTVRWTGSHGLLLWAGAEHRIEGSRFEGTGGIAMVLEGGDRATLASSQIVVEDTRIRGAGRIRRTDRGAWLWGVGIRFVHNEVSDGDGEALWFRGNDHRILANHFHHLFRTGKDGGAVYGGRSWVERGTVIRGNWIHDIGPPGASSESLVSGVYLDDGMSGVTIEGNVFSGVPLGVHLRGGHDDLVLRNLFVCPAAAIYLSRIGPWVPFAAALRAQVDSYRVDRLPYSRYSALRGFAGRDPWVPSGNAIRNNVIHGADLIERHDLRPWPRTEDGNELRPGACAGGPPTGAQVRGLIAQAREAGRGPEISLDSIGPRY